MRCSVCRKGLTAKEEISYRNRCEECYVNNILYHGDSTGPLAVQTKRNELGGDNPFNRDRRRKGGIKHH